MRDYGINGQIGLEQSPEDYVNKLVNVFREVKRVLRNDGTLWLNLGDSYAGNTKGIISQEQKEIDVRYSKVGNAQKKVQRRIGFIEGLKQKDLIGIPWRVAFALQADGWYLRSDIIWAKPNAMPESVKDRPTKAHEYMFLLSKNAKYYYDLDVIKEKAVSSGPRGGNSLNDTDKGPNGGKERWKGERKLDWGINGRNRRTVWNIATKPFKQAHFAVFPPDLIKPCILAGCPKCGIVLDPFGGSGTVAMVAQELGRDSIYIDLKPEYVEMAKRRSGGIAHQKRKSPNAKTEGQA